MAIEDEKLALNRPFLIYIHPLKTILNDVDQKECWIKQMKYLIQDFKILLNLPFNKFWSTIVFNKNATIGLCSFLRETAPPHMRDQFPQDNDMINIYKEIDHFAYLLLIRLTTSSENRDNYMSPHYMWGILHNNNIVNIPMLFDICSIYGQSYNKELQIIFKELFTCQKLYSDNLKNSIQIVTNCLSQFQNKIELEFENLTSAEIEETNIFMIEDIINFLLDTAYSISNFLEIYSNASGIFYQEKLHIKLASFYHHFKPLIYKKLITMNKLEQFQEKLHASRLLLVKSVRQCLMHLTDQIMNKMESENAIDEYLEVVNELLEYDEFVDDYNAVYNLTQDMKKYQKLNKKIDPIRYDYLLKSLELIDISNNKLEQKEVHEQRLDQQICNKNLENEKLQSLISDVKSVIPQLGNSFIQKCLEYYDMDTNKVINAVVKDNLPSELTKCDLNLPSMPEYDYENNATGYDKSAKGNRKLKTLKAVLDDKSFRNEMRTFYEKYNYTEITCAELESYYDDEYDDTYYGLEYEKPKPADKNEERRPNVVPRILTVKKKEDKVKEDTSDDEPQPVVNFVPFCENPEDVRKRQARRNAAKQGKAKVSLPITTPSGSNVDLDRQRKNENKALRGNHNRRNAAQKKQQKGMF